MTPPWPGPSAVPRPRRRSMVVLGVALVMNAAISVAALIVVLNRPAGPATYTAAERAAANERLCAKYRIAIAAVDTETHDGTTALARIALTNAAIAIRVALEDPAVDDQYRIAASSLALTFETMTAKGSTLPGDDPGIDALADQANVKDEVVKDLCGS